MDDRKLSAEEVSGATPAPYAGHESDCSIHNRGVPDLIGACDCIKSVVQLSAKDHWEQMTGRGDAQVAMDGEVALQTQDVKSLIEQIRLLTAQNRNLAQRVAAMQGIVRSTKEDAGMDTEAVAWAYQKLLAYGVGNTNMEQALMLDRLNLMLQGVSA